MTAWLEQRGVEAEALSDTEDAWNRGDLDAMLAHTPADAEWVIAKEHPGARTLRGPAEIRAYLEDWRSTVFGLRFEPNERRDAGDAVLTIGTISGRVGDEDGPEVTVPLAIVTRYDGGQVARTEEYLDVVSAFEAVALG